MYYVWTMFGRSTFFLCLCFAMMLRKAGKGWLAAWPFPSPLERVNLYLTLRDQPHWLLLRDSKEARPQCVTELSKHNQRLSGFTRDQLAGASPKIARHMAKNHTLQNLNSKLYLLSCDTLPFWSCHHHLMNNCIVPCVRSWSNEPWHPCCIILHQSGVWRDAGKFTGFSSIIL